MTKRQIERARSAIRARRHLIYDVAAHYGQVVENVCHMAWFENAVAEWLAA